jgi:K+-transporting ATPase ATPase C chain
MRRQLVTGLLMTIALTLVLGIAYPLVVTGVSQAAFSRRANGSFVKNAAGRVVGSSLIGQRFTNPQYFHPRPSAAGNGYDALASGASNLGPSNPKLLDDQVRPRIADYRRENLLPSDARVPVDAVTASASGLDPHISVANARIQARRVAGARDLTLAQVLRLVANHTQSRQWGVLGEKTVNVLTLNLALDALR